MKSIKVFLVLSLGIIMNMIPVRASDVETAKRILSDLAQICQKEGFPKAMEILNGKTDSQEILAQAANTSIRGNKIVCIHNSKIVANTMDPLSVNRKEDVTKLKNRKGRFPYQEMIDALKRSSDETAYIEIEDEDPTVKDAPVIEKWFAYSKKKLTGQTEFSPEEQKNDKFFCAVKTN